MEHGTCESIKKQSQMTMTIKTEVETAATSTSCIDVKIDLNHLKQEPGLVQFVKSEPALLVKEEFLEDSGQDGNDQQCIQGALTSAGTGSLNDGCSTSLCDLLNVKNELDMDIGPTVLQHMDTYYTINKQTMSAVTEDNTIVDDCNEAVPCSGVKKESVKDKLRGQNATMYERSACSMLQNLQLTVHKDQLESICIVHLIRRDTFQCDLCDVVYAEKRRLLQHLRSMHESRRPQTSLFVKLHKTNKQRRTAADKTIPCKYCGQKVRRDKTHIKFCQGQQKDRLRQHLTNSLNCFKTDRTISKPHLRSQNKLHQQNSKNISMMTSSVVTTSSQRRNETAKIKQKPNFHSKEYYSKTAKFALRRDFTKQIKVQTVEKRYRCNTCDAKFCRNSQLVLHIRVHTGEKPYQCDTCDKRFSTKSNLFGHRRVHTGEKPYRCDICDARFGGKSHLVRHMRVHTGEKPYWCDTCDKRFVQNSNLISHKRVIHTGERPYRCDTCDASFAYKNVLISHTRIHTGEKPYRCDTCDKRFVKKGNLVQHMRIHAKEKPYRCDTCNKRFAYNNALIQHRRVHTGDKPYLCDTCDARFSHHCNFIKHKKRVHMSQKP